MAKLKTPLYAGFNSNSYMIKMVRIEDIKIDPEISKLFKIDDKILEDIYNKMLVIGFDKAEPIVCHKGTMSVRDGHTRLAAAKKAGIEVVPVVEKDFESRDEAVMYTLERQILRRNLTANEILTVADFIKGRKQSDGTGRAVDILAKKFNIGRTTLYEAKTINERAPDDLKEKVRNGEISIKEAAKSVPPKQPKSKPREANFDAMNLPGSAKFLKSAVILLVEANQSPAAGMLINHFLKKHERNGFAMLLPHSIRELLKQESEIVSPAKQ